jgi:DNA-binding NtrC family response regulator
LVGFEWPGNVRQLRNVLEQAAIDSVGRMITAELLQRIISLSCVTEVVSSRAAPPSRNCFSSPDAEQPTHERIVGQSAEQGANRPWPTLERLEREHIARTLAHTYYNRSAAARLLGVTRQSLLRRMKRYGLDASGRSSSLD